MSNQLTGSAGPLIVRDIAGGFGIQPRGYLDFVATVNVADPAALTDLVLAMLSVDATGRLRVVANAAAGAIFQVQTTPAQTADTSENAARVVAPGAGVAVVTLAAPPAGTYEVAVAVGYDAGAPAAAELNNMEVQRGGAALFTPLQVLSVINVLVVKAFRVTFSGANNLSVNAIGAGTAGVGYTGAIIANRVA